MRRRSGSQARSFAVTATETLLVMEGVAARMGMPKPGVGTLLEGSETAIVAEPTLLTSAAAMGTCSCVALTNVAARAAPFQVTVDAVVKPRPRIVRVCA